MNRVFYGADFPNGFEEQFEYSIDVPYTIGIKNFAADDIVPLHYAKTIEILLCRNLKGTITIGGSQYIFSGDQLFVIPPSTVHSNAVYACSGQMYVFKISLPDMNNYINISNILNAHGSSLDMLEYCNPEVDKIKTLLDCMIDNDESLPRCLYSVMSILELLAQHTNFSRSSSDNDTMFKNSTLQELITWTQNNFMNKITLDDVALFSGYSKYYFCSRFKELTGIPYFSYLNSVRLSHAELLLRAGKPLQEVCEACGFSNVPYFIQLFKRTHSVTPYKYATHIGAHSAADSEGE